MFSSGHDLGSKQAMSEHAPGPDQHPSFQENGATRQGAEKLMLQEWHYFFENTPPLAQPPQDHRRPGARRRVCRRTHADVVV
jgi:hypothetical protein